ncbi:nocturnin isoform X1 [Anopheles arabiensis]|uniref:nocturnin isoform X1 n=2 Tax=Anopheles arabiensis TaxID=7173 RepID=UPI001AACD413|nr:nocturnin isoform X1 [Anopheles arabiensis]
MDLLPVGRFGPKALTEKLGTITRMLPDGSVGFLRGTCRKDSSANDDDADDVLAIAHGHRHRHHHHHHHAEGDDRVPRGAEDGEDEIDLSRFASEKEARAYFKRKLAIFEASMMTPVAANRRLAVRKLELEGGFGEPYGSSVGDNVGPMIDELDCIPPRQLLMYLVRMGSFTSAPQIKNVDYQDDKLEITDGMSVPDLVDYCRIARGDERPQLVKRKFLKPIDRLNGSDLTDGFKMLQLDSISKTCSEPSATATQLRIFQWNMLSQTLGMHNDGFVRCPLEALTWECRRYQVIEEIVQNDPDIICLQEVDHFKFLQKILSTQNYEGVFFPKPDSPCLYINGNNGPDGCAVFYKKDRLEMVNHFTRVLEVWRVQSNQVAIAAVLRTLDTQQEFCVTTTHLKARKGALLSKLRNEQGKDLLYFIDGVAENRPVILCGDFNAEPIEPIYSTVLNYKPLGLASAYSDLLAEESQDENNQNAINTVVERSGERCSRSSIGSAHSATDDCGLSNGVRTKAEQSAAYEPPYTTWKIREEGEVCHTIDYVFYSKDKLTVKNCLMFPSGEEIGVDRTPSFQYPSDHFSLVCDIELKPASDGSQSDVCSTIPNHQL